MTAPEFQPPEFGTDGLRGRAGQPPMDSETLRRVGAALGVFLQKAGPELKRVLVGNDGRESSDWILEALAQGLCATDVVVHDIGLITTPGLSFLTRTEPAVAGIMISASHNEATDNGIKIFQADGGKLPDDAEAEIAGLTSNLEFQPKVEPNIKTSWDLARKYEEHLLNLFPDLDLTGLRIVVDAANGAGSDIAPAVISSIGAEVLATACDPDGNNINDGVGTLHPEHLSKTVVESRADFGICLDGDGDRGMFVDASGSVHDGDVVMFVLGLHMQGAGQLPGNTVVATVMSNLGLRKALAEHGIALHITRVGDRAVVQAMREGGFALGGEQSGHIVLATEGNYAGDGIITALKLLSVEELRKHGLATACKGFRRYPQLLINVPVQDKPDLQELRPVQQAVAEVQGSLGEEGRVVLRYSGTENLCRVMVEGPSEQVVRAHAEHIADSVRKEIGT
ncbi:MAG: phosphoglucosamine mutase [Planctomycetota bacterium]|jgi:phosphoglucosamine mutase